MGHTDGLWGLMDCEGNVIAEPEWDDPGSFSMPEWRGGLLKVEKAGQDALINARGEIVVPPGDHTIDPSQKPFHLITDEDGCSWVITGGRERIWMGGPRLTGRRAWQNSQGYLTLRALKYPIRDSWWQRAREKMGLDPTPDKPRCRVPRPRGTNHLPERHALPANKELDDALGGRPGSPPRGG